MISTHNIGLYFGNRKLFQNITLKFIDGNCYGIIGANGAGKSTLLKILAGEIQPSEGHVEISAGQSLSILKQDHFQFDEISVLDTVMMGHERLFAIMQEKEALYAQAEMSEADGHKAAELEGEDAQGPAEHRHFRPLDFVGQVTLDRIMAERAKLSHPDNGGGQRHAEEQAQKSGAGAALPAGSGVLGGGRFRTGHDRALDE